METKIEDFPAEEYGDGFDHDESSAALAIVSDSAQCATRKYTIAARREFCFSSSSRRSSLSYSRRVLVLLLTLPFILLGSLAQASTKFAQIHQTSKSNPLRSLPFVGKIQKSKHSRNKKSDGKWRVAVFECPGGSDKGPDGHRLDTMPIVKALRRIGCDAEVVQWDDDHADDIFEYVSEHADCFLNRINPGTIPGGEAKCFDVFRRLSDAGTVAMPHPDTMNQFGAKDALARLQGTGLVPEDTFCYLDGHDLKRNFVKTLASGPRVLKQNRGSVGEGVWRVEILEGQPRPKPGKSVPLSTKVKCTEAVDNRVEVRTLGEFLEFCSASYMDSKGGVTSSHTKDNMVVDMKFLPRIREGEMRILMVGSKPLYVVHKKPAGGADAFSATLFSGAHYSYDDPKDWPDLVRHFVANLPAMRQRLLGSEDADLPPLWTADFIRDWDGHGNDVYYLSEINCSCVGFTSHLQAGIQENIADEIVRIMSSRCSQRNEATC